jgi:Flp pilus assembly protein CpaB
MEAGRPALAAGYRGLIMQLPEKQLKWVRKGDSLDVICVFDAVMGKKDYTHKEKIAATLLQNVRVAGVDARRGSIVLLVNPNEAQYAALALQQGNVSLSLRAEGDSAMSAMEVASFRKLIR